MKMCLHQFFRPKTTFPMKGRGDCSTCQPDEKNKECIGYRPINAIIYDVEE